MTLKILRAARGKWSPQQDTHWIRGPQSTAGYAADAAQFCRAQADRLDPLGNWACGHAIPRPDPEPTGWFEMELPNGVMNPERVFQSQRFVHHEATWKIFRIVGFTSRDTAIAQSTKNVAGVQVVRPEGTADWSHHNADILFTFCDGGHLSPAWRGQGSLQTQSWRRLRHPARNGHEICRAIAKFGIFRSVPARRVRNVLSELLADQTLF